MPEAEWGTKRICPTTGQRFYDLNKDPIVSPYTGEVVSVDSNKGRTMVADAQDAQTKKMEEAEAEAENVVLEDDVEVDLGDDVLEDDDDDTVSLDEITDVAAEDDDS